MEGRGAERNLCSCVQLLENLVVAMESESQVIDISRVSGFMQKVRVGCTAFGGGVLMLCIRSRLGSERCDIAGR